MANARELLMKIRAELRPLEEKILRGSLPARWGWAMRKSAPPSRFRPRSLTARSSPGWRFTARMLNWPLL